MPLGVLDSSLTSLLPKMFEPPDQSLVRRSAHVQREGSAEGLAIPEQEQENDHPAQGYPALSCYIQHASGGGRARAPLQDLPISLNTTGLGI